jgi:AcrR family transcriptional regulator
MRDLLLERDFDQIATEEILARAGVSRGGMYHHFASKVDLF